MDRYDEKIEKIEDRDDEQDTEGMQRTGDVLGLGGGAVPKMPGDPSASNDPDSVARRRERAREDDETLTSHRDDPYRQGHGATGIDMGSGGRGTDVSGE
jgi:hypothetical protein